MIDLDLGQWQEKKGVTLRPMIHPKCTSSAGGPTRCFGGCSRWTWKGEVVFEQGCRDRDQRPVDKTKASQVPAKTVGYHGVQPHHPRM